MCFTYEIAILPITIMTSVAVVILRLVVLPSIATAASANASIDPTLVPQHGLLFFRAAPAAVLALQLRTWVQQFRGLIRSTCDPFRLHVGLRPLTGAAPRRYGGPRLPCRTTHQRAPKNHSHTHVCMGMLNRS